MKKMNRKGFTLIELLALISVLGIVSVITTYSSVNIIGSAKLKSYLASSNNVEKTSALYVVEENNNIIWKDNSINSDLEYTCVIVKDLIESGYFKSDVLDSIISENRNLKEDDYVYIERNKSNKSITKNTLLIDSDDSYITSCIANRYAGKINISISPTGWSKEKDALINYELIKFDGDYNDYSYEYSFLDDNYSNSFNNNSVSKNVNISNNGYLYASIKDKDNNIIVSKTLEITKIDNIGPKLELLVNNGNIYKQSNSISLKLIDNESGLKKGNYDIYYQWSSSNLSCNDLLNSSNSEKVTINVSKDSSAESEVITKNISNKTGSGTVYACLVNASDMVENEVNNVLVSSLMYLDNEKPVVSLGNYTGSNEVKDMVSIPIIVKDKYSGVNPSSFTSSDIIVKIGDKTITSGITLNKKDDNNYNLVIKESINSGNIKIIVDDNNILDNAGNGNKYTEINTNIAFKNTYTISYDANGGSGAPEPQIGIIGDSIKITNVKPSKTGYSFLGWSTSKTATSATYQSGSLFTGKTNTTLYAVWKACFIPTFTYTGKYEIVDDKDNVISNTSNYCVDNWKIRFLTSGTLTFTALGDASDGIDVFLVGGGGRGGGTYAYNAGYYGFSAGGGGGGGGYTTTKTNVSIASNTAYKIVIGAGATSSTSSGTSSAFGYTAKGGGNGGSPPCLTKCNTSCYGAAGSGTGKGGYGQVNVCQNGESILNGKAGVHEFNDSSYSKLYGGGGGSGHGHNGATNSIGTVGSGGAGGGGTGNNTYRVPSSTSHNGTANTGGGGGGASYRLTTISYSSYQGQTAAKGITYPAGNGGSGIVIIRNTRS